MKIGILNQDLYNDYKPKNYPQGLELCSMHSALKDQGHQLCLLVKNEKSIKNIEKNKKSLAYIQAVNFDICDFYDKSIDVYHVAIEAWDSPKVFAQWVPELNEIISFNKPIVYTDSNQEIEGILNKSNRVSTALYLIDKTQSPINIHCTCKTSPELYELFQDHSRAFYLPYLLHSNIQKAFTPNEFLPQDKDFVYVGRVTGRPHLKQFYQFVIDQNMTMELDGPFFDQINWTNSGMVVRKGLAGSGESRSDHYQKMSQYRFTFIGSSWHSKSWYEWLLIGNPTYSTFRPCEVVFSNQLFASYKTPELVDAKIDSRLLMDWTVLKDYESERRCVSLIKEIIQSGEYESLKSDTHTKLINHFSPGNWSEVINNLFTKF